MCDPISLAIIGSTVVSAGIADHQGSKQREQMRKQAEEAEAERKRREAQFAREKEAADAVPTLLRNETQKGMNKMQIKKNQQASYGGSSGGSGSALGTGGASGTGLNIAS
jgi:predicted phage gp36 major capsid-like protein